MFEIEFLTVCMSAAASAPVAGRRNRPRANYFMPRDIVWVRPARLPYWPAEVQFVDEGLNIVVSKLILPPPLPLLEANVEQERRQWRSGKRAAALKKRKCEGSSSAHQSTDRLDEVVDEEPEPAFHGDVVTTNGTRVYFFDKLTTPEEFEACMEHRLKRSAHDVSAYESALYKAVLYANRLVRIVLSPEMLKPYQVCGVGVVHSLMRCHTAAPRQPHTGKFEPQSALIRLRKGLENAARDVAGFEYIWVLFQFSYAAAMATGAGQECIRRMQEGGKEDAVTPPPRDTAEEAGEARTRDVPAVHTDPMTSWRTRQGVANSAGFKTMIIPPRDEELRGVFATRSPHRPNFIGLSCVKLVAVRGLDIHIVDHDLLHGTPVLDIKPYLPFCDAHPDARTGWVGDLDAQGKGKADHKYDRQEMFVHRIFEDPPVGEAGEAETSHVGE